MRKEYESPEMKIKRIDFSDILTSSLTGDQETHTGNDTAIDAPVDSNPFIAPSSP